MNQMETGQLKLLLVQKSDFEFLYTLRNHPSTRKRMFNPDEITRQEHAQWFSSMLADINCKMFILLDGSQKVGQIRFNRNQDSAQLDISILPKLRGNGYGTLLLILACQRYLNENQDIRFLAAKIFEDNFKSIHAFKKAGFRHDSHHDRYLEFKLYQPTIKPNMVVATIKSWNIDNFDGLKTSVDTFNWILLNKKCLMDPELIREISPRYIFFPHWSWVIPKEIYTGFECIVFHMTDLPFGRGGSPLQNLLAKGIYQTKISAIRVEQGIDTGPVYCKKPLDLNDGNADEIFKSASDIIFKQMIPLILKSDSNPRKQEGEVTEFKRRHPEDSNLEQLKDISQVYDFIRMMDGEDYPKAFVQKGNFRYEFSQAKRIKDDQITAICTISKIKSL